MKRHKKMKFALLHLILLSVSYVGFSQCSLSLDVGASGCYWNGSASKTKVVVEVSWNNAPNGQNIIVTGPPGSTPATRTITPGTISVTYLNHAVPPVSFATANQIIVSPQLVTFEMDANGATGLTVSANFSSTTSCNTTSNTFSLPVACTPLDCNGTMSGGTVFFDFNADGIRTSDETETGVVGVTITAIDVNGVVYSTTSQKYGRWSMNIPTNAYPIRVEFSNLPNYARQGTLNGTDGRTTTQFIQAPDCNIDLGVLENSEFASANPAIFLTQMPSGNPLDPTGNVKDMDALVKVDYDAQGARDPSKTHSLAKADEIGCTWGLAHNKYTNKLFVSAFIRRHSGLGPKGIGGIYVVDPTTGLADSWDVESDFGIDVGSISDNFTRGLNKNVSGSSVDPEGLAKTCKEGIGDMDISENGNQLYFVNMYDKKLYRIDLTTYNSSGTKPSSVNITSWPITNPSCIGGNFRPMGLKWYKGFLYVGVICDGESSNTKSNLRAFLYKLNPGNGVWATMFDFPLTYPKGFPNKDNRDITGWYPWTDIWSDFIELSPLAIAYPQPVFSDIEFDVDGSIVLAFGDRNGFQTGYKNKSNPDDGKQYSGFVGGDILRAFNNGSGKFILESNAMAGPNVGYAPGNNQGPGFGEYYNDDWIGDKGNLNHAECVLGALALKPGEGKVIVTIIDPVDSINWAGGFRFYDNASGLRTQAFTIYETDVNDIGTFAKSGGLGDMELLMELPTFIEIGNRAWIDDNKDGVQDPNEGPLLGLKVALYKSGVKIAETITNSNGEYYFSSKSSPDPNLTWIGTGNDTTLLPLTSYQVLFGESQYSAAKLTISGIDYQLTTVNSTSGTGNDQNDSDASIITNFPRINFNSPISGAVNHTYDVGFWPVPVCVPPNATVNPTNPSCTGSNAPNNGILTIAGFATGQRYQYSVGSVFNSGSATPATITTIPVGGVIVSNLPNTTQQYTVRIYDATDNACFVDRTVSITMVSCVNCNCPCTSLIGNSSFESNLDDWVSFRVTSGTQTQYAVCGSKAGFMYYDNSGSEGNLYQELQTAIPGNTYTLTVYAGTGDANQVDQVRLKFLAGDYSQELQFVADIDHNYTTTGGLVKYTLVGICPVWADLVEVKFATENTSPVTKLVFDHVCLCSTSNPCIVPTANVSPTNPSCTGANAPNNGMLTINGFTTGQRYQYSIGATFNSGSGIPATIAAIPPSGVIVNNLSNTTQQYTVRIYDASDNACFVDRTVAIVEVNCACSSILTANASPCNPTNNQYTLSGQITLTNPPASGTLTVQISGGGSQTFDLASGIPTSYSIPNQNADGAVHSVNLSISGASCADSQNFTAPVSCLTAPCPDPNCGTLKSKKVIQN